MKIREKDKQSIISIAKSIFNEPVEIIAFGSRVNGDAHETSDLDLVVVAKEKKLDIDVLSNFKDKIQKSNIPIIVQVLDWHRIPKSFHKNILQRNELLVKI